MKETPPALEAIDIRHRRGEQTVVDGISLRLEKGRILGLLGPNGAGKSTLLHILAGVLTPDEGAVRIDGGIAAAGSGLLRRIGYLPEERGVYRKMRVLDFVRYMAKLKGVDRPGFDRVIADWLDRIELPGVARKPRGSPCASRVNHRPAGRIAATRCDRAGAGFLAASGGLVAACRDWPGAALVAGSMVTRSIGPKQ